MLPSSSVGAFHQSFRGHFGNVEAMVLSRDGSHLLSADDKGSLLIWRVGPAITATSSLKGQIPSIAAYDNGFKPVSQDAARDVPQPRKESKLDNQVSHPPSCICRLP